MATVKALLFKGKQRKDKKHPIVIQITMDRQTRRISTGYYAHAKNWNSIKQEPKPGFPNRLNRMNDIRRMVTEIEDVIIDLKKTKESFGFDEIKSSLTKKNQRMSVFDFLDQYIDRLNQMGKYGNRDTYKDLKSNLLKFRGCRDFAFEEITYAFLIRYEEFMISRGNKTNTAGNRLRTLRALINKAINEGLVHERFYAFKKFKIKKGKTQHKALSESEILKIEKFECDNNQLTWARNIFLFSFYCQGMNVADLIFVKYDNIQATGSEQILYYQRRKTGQILNIKIHEKLRNLMNLMKRTDDQEYIVPIPNESVRTFEKYDSITSWLNTLLKRIGKELSLSITLTSNVARHSYATIAREKGIDINIISQALAHTNETTTRIYIDSISNDTVAKANELIFS